jgi:hypothetical protein
VSDQPPITPGLPQQPSPYQGPPNQPPAYLPPQYQQPQYQAPQYQGPPFQGPQYAGVQPPPPPRRKSNTGLIIGIIAAGLVVLLGICIGGIALLGASKLPTTTADVRNSATAPVGQGEPTSGDTSDSETNSSNLPLGTKVTFSDTDGKWTVVVSAAKWYTKPCNSLGVDLNGKLVVVDVAFEVVEGTASINPLFFKYIDQNGAKGDYSFFSGCDEPTLDSGNDFSAGTKRTGKIGFEVKSGLAGMIEYEAGFSSVRASWSVAAP